MAKYLYIQHAIQLYTSSSSSRVENNILYSVAYTVCKS